MIQREHMPLVNKLTNWQRKQWARAGYPDDRPSLKRFARLQRDGTELYEGVVASAGAENVRFSVRQRQQDINVSFGAPVATESKWHNKDVPSPPGGIAIETGGITIAPGELVLRP